MHHRTMISMAALGLAGALGLTAHFLDVRFADLAVLLPFFDGSLGVILAVVVIHLSLVGVPAGTMVPLLEALLLTVAIRFSPELSFEASAEFQSALVLAILAWLAMYLVQAVRLLARAVFNSGPYRGYSPWSDWSIVETPRVVVRELRALGR